MRKKMNFEIKLDLTVIVLLIILLVSKYNS